jgi:type VI secretion system secreted protein Hcp
LSPVSLAQSAQQKDALMRGNVFLKITTQRAGIIKGEAKHAGHVDDIDIDDFRFSIDSPSAIGGAGATGRRLYSNVRVLKLVDKSTPGLMTALATNDEVKEAVFSVYKAGSQPWLYYKLILTKARISKYECLGLDPRRSTDGPLGGTFDDALMTEAFEINFADIEVQYMEQSKDGTLGGNSSFRDQIGMNS